MAVLLHGPGQHGEVDLPVLTNGHYPNLLSELIEETSRTAKTAGTPIPRRRASPGARGRAAPRADPLRTANPLLSPDRVQLPASQATGLPSCCLCTNMWITCAQPRRACAYAVEMLGIPLPGRNHDRGLNLGERESHPVHTEKTGIIHMPRRNR
jgi:hypothetical protein